MAEKAGYSGLQIALHWMIAILIFAAWSSGDGMQEALRARMVKGDFSFDPSKPHTLLGGAAFALILVRVIVRLFQGAPGPLPDSTPIMAAAAKWGHILIYVLMIATPALGAAAWYGGVKAAADLHETVANTLLIVAFAHATMAIVHQAMGKNALSRMIVPGSK